MDRVGESRDPSHAPRGDRPELFLAPFDLRKELLPRKLDPGALGGPADQGPPIGDRLGERASEVEEDRAGRHRAPGSAEPFFRARVPQAMARRRV